MSRATPTRHFLLIKVYRSIALLSYKITFCPSDAGCSDLFPWVEEELKEAALAVAVLVEEGSPQAVTCYLLLLVLLVLMPMMSREWWEHFVLVDWANGDHQRAEMCWTRMKVALKAQIRTLLPPCE